MRKRKEKFFFFAQQWSVNCFCSMTGGIKENDSKSNIWHDWSLFFLAWCVTFSLRWLTVLFDHCCAVPIGPEAQGSAPRHTERAVWSLASGEAGVHANEPFFLLALSLHSLPAPTQAVRLLSFYESVSILLVSSVCSFESTYEWNHRCLSFSDWLISLSIMFSRPIHTVAKGKIFFFFIVE